MSKPNLPRTMQEFALLIALRCCSQPETERILFKWKERARLIHQNVPKVAMWRLLGAAESFCHLQTSHFL